MPLYEVEMTLFVTAPDPDRAVELARAAVKLDDTVIATHTYDDCATLAEEA